MTRPAQSQAMPFHSIWLVGACLCGSLLSTAADAIDVTGTSGNDTFDFSAHVGPYTVLTLGGADTVYGSVSGDQIDGGAGVDKLFGNDGDDTIKGASGNDLLDGGRGNDTFTYAGSNNGFDDVSGGSDLDVLQGSAGNDVIGLRTMTGVEVIDGQAGNDILQLPSQSGIVLDLGAVVVSRIELISGGTRADTVVGSNGDDTFKGNGGNDQIDGRLGRDTASFTGESLEYVIAYGSSATTVTHALGTDGTDTLRNIEVLSFLDGWYDEGTFFPRYPENVDPSALDDSATVGEDGVVEVAVLANDSDADDEPLSLKSFTQGAHGNVALGVQDSLIYTPAPNFNGSDSFTYTTTDPRFGRATARVTITVVPAPDAPTASPDSAEAKAGASVDIFVLLNDVDVDGDALVVSSVTLPAHGTATVQSSTVRYTPTSGFSGTDSFFYTIRDATGRTASAQVTVTVTAASLNGELLQLLTNAPDGSWLKINKNLFSDVWVPSNQRPVGANLPGRIISAWSSMAWDPNRGDLIFWGGGHKNYSGNELYRFRTSTLRWERASLPSEIYQPLGDQQWFAIDGPFNAPTASHTYDNQEFLPIADRFITFGGAKFNEQERFVLLDGVTATGPYLFDPNRADANKVGGSTGSHVNTGAFPWVTGGQMWENRNSAEVRGIGAQRPTGRGRWVNATTAYAEHEGKDAIYLSDSPANGKLYRFVIDQLANPDNDSWELVGIKGPGHSNQGAGAVDSDRGLFVRTANSGTGYVLVVWDLSKAGPLNKSFHVSFPASTGFSLTKYHGLDFDTRRGLFVLWDGGPDVWLVNPPAVIGPTGWTVTKATMRSSSYGTPQQSDGTLYSGSSTVAPWGILGKWKYARGPDVFFGVEDPHRGDVWVYKPSNWAPVQ